MKNTKKLVLIITAILISSIFIEATSALLTTNELKTRGSSTVLPISDAMEGDFENLLGGGFNVITDGGGSGEGWDCIAGDDDPINHHPDSDVGAMSREPKGSEWVNYPLARCWQIGKDSVAIAVHKDNPITQLDMKTIQRIFTLPTKGVFDVHYWENWDDLFDDLGITGYGAEWIDEPIWRIYRPLESGTHDAFNSFFLNKDFGDGKKPVDPLGDPPDPTKDDWADRQEEIEDNGIIYNRLNSPAGKFQISYFGAGFADYPDPPSGDYVRGVEIDFGTGSGATWVPSGSYYGPTYTNVLAGTYPVSRNLYYITRRMPSKDSITSDSTNDFRASIEVARWVSFALNNPAYVENEGYLAKGDQTIYGLGTWRRADFTALNSTKFVPSGATYPITFPGLDGGPSRVESSPRHDPLPNNAMDGGDVLYLTNAWRHYFFDDNFLNPYVDISGNGEIDGQDVLGFTARWREFFFP